jgi:hypothetical protein
LLYINYLMQDYQNKRQKAERLYDKFGKPLEKDHRGEYVAISDTGKTVLGKTLIDVLKAAEETIGRGSFVFRVGARTVGTLR